MKRLTTRMAKTPVTLLAARPSDFAACKRDLQAAFALALVEEMGGLPHGPIPSDADLDGAMAPANAIVLHIFEHRRVGGAVLTINPDLFRSSGGSLEPPRRPRCKSFSGVVQADGNRNAVHARLEELTVEKTVADWTFWCPEAR